jgi:AbiV family abortive infection protein
MKTNEFYLEGANFAYRNALTHYKAAKYLATHVNLGIANSHLILGAEEAIKALVLCRKHAGDKISDDKFRPFFTDHKYKHGFLKRSLRKIDPMHKLYLVVMSAMSTEEGLLRLEKEHGVKMTKREFIKLARKRFNTEEDEKEHKKVAQWLDKANDMKNSGLYVGLSRNSDKWLLPKSIAKEQFNESLEIVKHIINYYVGPWIGLYSTKVISGDKNSDNYLKP